MEKRIEEEEIEGKNLEERIVCIKEENLISIGPEKNANEIRGIIKEMLQRGIIELRSKDNNSKSKIKLLVDYNDPQSNNPGIGISYRGKGHVLVRMPKKDPMIYINFINLTDSIADFSYKNYRITINEDYS